MTINRTNIYRAVRATLFAAGTSMFAFAAFAQSTADTGNSEKNATNLKAVIVTGSHIRRVDLETANPVLSVSTAQIASSGAATLGDLVQQLPAMTGAAVNPQNHTSGNSRGDTQLSLRGLGPNRTLILVDGHRVVSGDVSSIPA
jgi:outer membrane receptor for ferrienterochelin and colicin